VKVGAHVEVIQISLMNTGLYLGSINPELIKEIGIVMVKYGVRHLEAVLIPCLQEQVVKFEAVKKDETDEDAVKNDPSGP
jgi:hypothetical protein